MTAKTKTGHTRISKWCALELAILCTCHTPFFAQAAKSQTVSPRQIYTGDSVRVSYSFESDVDFFAIANLKLFAQDTMPQGERDRLEFDFLNEQILENPSDALVQECTLRKNKGGWTFSVVMIPWQTGQIRFRAIDLKELCTSGKVSSLQAGGSGDFVALEPVEVLSVSKKTGETVLRDTKEPLLLPRTRRTLRLSTIAAILVVAAILVLCRRKIARSLRALIVSLAYKRNAHITRKRLLRLLKAPLSDKATCQRWLQTMKPYLSVRFGRDFAQARAQDISKQIFDATGGLLTESRQQAVDNLALLFARATYIAQATRVGEPIRFSSGEKETFLSDTLKVIDTFEVLGDEGETSVHTEEGV